MMIVNGHRAADVLVWSAEVAVEADTQYDFSAWAASLHRRSPASLAFSINGVRLDAPLTLPSTLGSWQQFTAGWYSGGATRAILSVVDLNTDWNGNDFALDDFALTVAALDEPPGPGPLSVDDDPPGDDPGDGPVQPQFPLDPPVDAVVPEPASLVLFGSSLIGLAGLAKRRATKAR
jgi:hypothetical protein